MGRAAKRTEVAIVGGGVIGCSIAYHLARGGARVQLFEAREIPSGASAASAGGVRQQGRDPRELRLAIASIARWEQLESELEADVHYRRQGHLRVVEDEARLPEVLAWMEEQQAAGLDIRLVAGDELRRTAPGLADTVAFGTFTPDDGHANPILTTKAFAAAAARHGAQSHPFTPVVEIEVESGRARGLRTEAGTVACEHVVLAAGAWSVKLARSLGVVLPIEARGLQMMATTPAPPSLRPVVGALGRSLSLKQVPSGNYVIGGGWPGSIDLERRASRVWQSSVSGSARASSAVFPPLLTTRLERVWVGIEAVCADEVPLLGQLPGIEGLTVATGFSGHGFALSPIIGQVISELILAGRPSHSIAQLSLERFDQGARQAVPQDVRAG